MKSKSEKRKRTLIIQVRVTPAEKARFQERCANAQLSEPDYIRVKCFQEAPLRAIRNVNPDRQLLAMALANFSRFSNNINQIAKHLNTFGEVYREDIAAIHQALNLLRSLRTDFRKALGYDS